MHQVVSKAALFVFTKQRAFVFTTVIICRLSMLAAHAYINDHMKNIGNTAIMAASVLAGHFY